MLGFLYLYVMLSILLSILLCVAASLFCACLVSVQVSAPYVIAGSTHELYTCLFRQRARLLLKISRCLAYAAQPAMIRRCISLYCLFLEAVVLSQEHVALDIFKVTRWGIHTCAQYSDIFMICLQSQNTSLQFTSNNCHVLLIKDGKTEGMLLKVKTQRTFSKCVSQFSPFLRY